MFDLRSAITDRGYFFVSAGWSVFKQSKAMLSQTKLQSGQRAPSPPAATCDVAKKKNKRHSIESSFDLGHWPKKAHWIQSFQLEACERRLSECLY